MLLQVVFYIGYVIHIFLHIVYMYSLEFCIYKFFKIFLKAILVSILKLLNAHIYIKVQ